jgi:hypothetical protein
VSDLRAAIIRGLCYTTDAPDYDDATQLIDAILALPEMQARERVIEAARAWNRATGSDGEPELCDALEELDASA